MSRIDLHRIAGGVLTAATRKAPPASARPAASPAKAPATKDGVDRGRALGPFTAQSSAPRSQGLARVVASVVQVARAHVTAVKVREEQNRSVAAPGVTRLGAQLEEMKRQGLALQKAVPQWSTQDWEAKRALEGLGQAMNRIRAAEGDLAKHLAGKREGGDFFEGVDKLRKELDAIRGLLPKPEALLRGSHPGAQKVVKASLDGLKQALERAGGELHMIAGRARVGEQMGALEGAAPGLSDEEVRKIGTGLPASRRPPQTLWNEGMVSAVRAEGRKQKGLTEAQAARNAELARSVLDRDPGPAPRATVTELTALVRESGLPLERLDPHQLVAAAAYVDSATSASDLQAKLGKVLDTFHILDRIGLPKLPSGTLVTQLEGQAYIPPKVSKKLKAGELPAKFQEVAVTLNAGGKLHTKLSNYTLDLKVDNHGQLLESKCKKDSGFWGGIADAFTSLGKGIVKGLKTIAPYALTVLSFVPQTAVFARLAQGALALYQAVRSKSPLGLLSAGAGLVGAGVAAFAGKAVGVAGSLANRFAAIADGTARTLQGIQAARQGSLLSMVAGVGGAVAGGFGSVAGAFGQRFQGVAETLSVTATRLSAGAAAIQAAARGDLLGAVGLGANLAADFSFTGPKLDASLRKVAQGVTYARAAEKAMREGDYLAAAAAATSLASRVAASPGGQAKLAENLQKAAGTLSRMSAAQASIQSGDFLSAAAALTEAAGAYGRNEQTRRGMLETAQRLQEAAQAYDRARKGDYAGAAEQLARLGRLAGWDVNTRKRFDEAVKVFRTGSGIAAALQSGDYRGAASVMSKVASGFAGEKRNAWVNATRYLEEAAAATELVRQKDYAGAAARLAEMAGEPGVFGGEAARKLQDVAAALDKVEDVKRALEAGDPGRAAVVLASTVGLGREVQQSVIRAASVFSSVGQLSKAVDAGDAEGIRQAADAMLRELGNPPPAVASGLARLRQAFAAAADLRSIVAEAGALRSVLVGLVSDTARSLGTMVQAEAQAVLRSQSQALAAGLA